MTRSEFKLLLQRYTDGDCTEDEKMQIQTWFDRIKSKNNHNLTEEEKEIIEIKLLSEINQKIDNPLKDVDNQIKFSDRLNSFLLYTGVAASLVLTIFLTRNDWKTMKNLVSYYGWIKQDTENGIVTKINNGGQTQLITLSDSSLVHLSKGSSITYKTNFEKDQRIVRLKGSGFFNVTKNARRPFLVLCRGTVTRVIGTSFSINTDSQNKCVEIAVKTGKVSVFINSSKKSETISSLPYSKAVFLTPNERVIVSEEKEKIEKKLVSKPVLLTTPEISSMKFVYNETPLKNVIEDLAQSYGVQISLSNPKLQFCSFNGDLTNMTFDEKLDLVCKSVGSKYSIDGTSIILTGNGCK